MSINICSFVKKLLFVSFILASSCVLAETELVTPTYLEDKVKEITSPASSSTSSPTSKLDVASKSVKTKAVSVKTNDQPNNQPVKKAKFLSRKSNQKAQTKNNSNPKNAAPVKDSADTSFAPVDIDGNNPASVQSSSELLEQANDKPVVKSKTDKELKQITKDRQKNTQKTIDAMNFIQPSLDLSKEEQLSVDTALTRIEQEELTLLWRATLERNKTIRFIVEKLTPESKDKKKNQILSQVLNTAIFLPFYALQSVAPADTSALASYVGAGLAGDIINGRAAKNNDKMQLSQTEMVIMFMMIDQVAERVRTQFHSYKQERIDELLALNELEEAKVEAAAALDASSPESQFLSQVRIRQIERELRRISLRARSNRIVLVDLSGTEAVDQVDQLMRKEIKAVLDLPSVVSIQ